MRKVVAVSILAVTCAAALLAQDKPQERRAPWGWVGPTYQLDFTVKELDDEKVVNTRSYTMVLFSSDEQGRSDGDLRAVTKVPVQTAGKNGEMTTQYMDVGFRLSAHLYNTETGLILLTNAEISGLAPVEGGQPGANPIVRSVVMSSGGRIIPGKTKLLSSVDDVNSKHRFQFMAVAQKAE